MRSHRTWEDLEELVYIVHRLAIANAHSTKCTQFFGLLIPSYPYKCYLLRNLRPTYPSYPYKCYLVEPTSNILGNE